MADKGKHFSMPAFLSAGEKTAIRKKKYTEEGTLRFSLFKATQVNSFKVCSYLHNQVDPVGITNNISSVVEF